LKEKFCLDLNLNDLTEWCAKREVPKYRASQIYGWLSSGCVSTDEMTNVPKNVRAMLEEDFIFGSFELREHLTSKIDGTEKFVYALYDGNIIETVAMRYKPGISVCVSSQAGCKMGCTFCASAKIGFGRSLTSGEILAQVAVTQKILGERIRSVVIMGIGEPFDNYENVMGFIKLANDPEGLNLGARHITLSTCGLVPKIEEFTREGLQVNLSISLHAPNDELRKKLMPVAKAYSIEQLMNACKEYTKKTNRRVTFEYSLFAGVNDTPQCASELVKLLKGGLYHVNLIAANEVPGTVFKSSSPAKVKQFRDILESGGINATIRREMGSDIMAACGQLRRGTIEAERC
jgi:23S rRNA (adenine2503-C2)-methyltransferase